MSKDRRHGARRVEAWQALALAISLMVSADIRARSVASAGQYAARAEIARAYIGAFGAQPPTSGQVLAVLQDLAAATAHGHALHLKTGDQSVHVKQVKAEAGSIYVRKSSADPWAEVENGARFEMQ